MVLLGDCFSSDEYKLLTNDKRKPFRTGGVDSFILGTEWYLNFLNYSFVIQLN